jgi:hypothetical protein
MHLAKSPASELSKSQTDQGSRRISFRGLRWAPVIGKQATRHVDTGNGKWGKSTLVHGPAEACSSGEERTGKARPKPANTSAPQEPTGGMRLCRFLVEGC